MLFIMENGAHGTNAHLASMCMGTKTHCILIGASHAHHAG